jgi:hypothetical protein
VAKGENGKRLAGAARVQDVRLLDTVTRPQF